MIDSTALPTPEPPSLGAEPQRALARRLWRFVRLAREWDARFEKLFRLGSISKWYSGVGNEATTVAAADALEAGDALSTLHRDSGAILRHYARFDALDSRLEVAPPGVGADRELLYRLACQLFGKRDGFSAGYERSFHYSAIDEGIGLWHVGMISHLGAMIPVAAGLGLALHERLGDRVALSFIGDGGTSTGDFHEGLNLAAVWRLPLVLVVENNRWAFSTPLHEQLAAASIASRGVGYGIPGITVDGNDPLAVHEAVSTAVARARRGEGPTLIEAVVGRMRGHSEGDDSLSSVPPSELERYLREDPVESFERRLLDAGVISAEEAGELRELCARVVVEVADRALAAADPELSAPRRSVFESPVLESRELVASASDPSLVEETSYLDAIARGLHDEMREDPSVVVWGQDVAAFGGAFKLTRGLLQEFGPTRVRNTPIAESGTLGAAVGAALAGVRPVVEMQFADFVTCGFNQLVNVAAKFRWRTLRSVPLVVRLPYGGGVGAGPFHSQSPEAWFLHVAGLKVVAPSTPADAYRLLRASIRDPDPVLFLEHKQLYRRLRGPLVGTDESTIAPKSIGVRLAREGRDATILTWGWMVHRALEAAELLAARGRDVQVVDLRVLCPLDVESIVEAVRSTGRVLVAHEAPLTGGFGGELAARLADSAFDWLDAPVRRLAFDDTPIPFHKSLEAAALPDAERIAAAAEDLIRR